MRCPRSRAAQSRAAASSKSSSSTIASTGSGPAASPSSSILRRRPPAAPAPDGVSLTGRTTALRARSSCSSLPSSTRPVSTGSSSASSRRCNGSPRRRSARATSSLTPAEHAVDPFAPVVAVRQTPRKSGAAPGVRRATASSVVELPTSTPPTSTGALCPHAVSPRRTYALRASRTSAAHRCASRASSRSASSSSSSAVARPGRSDS